MRATISFETDVSKVEKTMKALIKTETDDIRDIAHKIETAKEHNIEQVVTDCLEDLYSITGQLEQFKTMLQSFGRAKYEMITPRNADTPVDVNSMRDAVETAQTMERFDQFISSINENNEEAEKEDEEG